MQDCYQEIEEGILLQCWVFTDRLEMSHSLPCQFFFLKTLVINQAKHDCGLIIICLCGLSIFVVMVEERV